MGIQYRPEIDGLRAIAVLAVVLFHAGIGDAGFVGVDVFFVISGYLITSLLLKEHATTGAIDLLAFYARRVRRIVPAAAVVVIAVLVASYFLLPSDAQVHTAQSAGAALVFGANVLFQATTGGYWDAAADEMPLLHLWSLAVEEQFYVLWPALLIGVLAWARRRGVDGAQRLARVTAGVAFASFLLAEACLWKQSDAAFYSMPTRWWELAAGAMVALLPMRVLPRWFAWAGIAVTLLACALRIDHFPGYGALPAVIGAVMIIAAVHNGARNAWLASRPMVVVGKISYSLYLWHWPLLAFYSARTVDGGELGVRLALCGVAVVLAIASYYCVEQPCRRMRWPSGRTVAFGAAASGMLALSACAVGLQTQATAKANADAIERRAWLVERDYVPGCAYGPDDAIPKCPDPPNARVAIWGDSMAGSWRPALPDATIAYSLAGCFPMVGYAGRKGDMNRERCASFNQEVRERVRGLDTVYLVGRWQLALSLDDLDKTLDIARDVRRVVLIGPTPEMRAPVAKCIRTHSEAKCGVPRREFDATAVPILAKLRAIAAKHANVEVIDVTSHFCTATLCPPILGDVALYADARHISATAARANGAFLQ